MSERNPLTDEQLDAIREEMLKSDAKKPPRLDRLAWEPCILCAVGDWKHLEYSFCPHCGRPLTYAAWDVLEKRLEGNK